jgi:hypothetical protein
MATDRTDPTRPLFADMDDDDEVAGQATAAAPTPGSADPLTIDSAGGGAIPLGSPATVNPDERDPVDRDVSDPRGH